MAKSVKKLAVFDRETGEVVEHMVVFVGEKPTRLDKGYVKVFVSFLEDIVRNEKITGKAIKLLLYMLQDIDWNDLEVYMYPETAAKDLGVDRRTIYNWIDALIEANIIEKTEKKYIYRLRAYTAIRGKMSEVLFEQQNAV